MPITDILNIAKLGLIANQGSLKVVSHNIANVNTAGYSRQNAQLSSVAAAKGAVNTGGQGVNVAQVRQQVDALVERRLNIGQRELGRLESRNRYLPIIERAFNDLDGDGLGGRMESFFAAADQLASNATNPVGRTQLVVEGENLARFANDMFNTLSEITLPVDSEITLTLEDINRRLLSVRDINMEIIKQQSGEHATLDLQDQRQNALNELGKKLDILILDQPDGGVSVMTTGGKLLVDHTYTATLSRGGPRTPTDMAGIRVDDRNEDLSTKITSGELKGLLEIRDNLIHGQPNINGKTGWLYRLNTLVGELRWQTNLASSQSVGSRMFTSQQGAFTLGTDLTSTMATLETDPKATLAGVNTYDGSPPDIRRVQAGILTVAYGNDMDNLNTTTIAIDPATQSIADVVAALNASPAFTSSIVGNRVALAAKSSYYGVVSDTSGIMAGLGIGTIFGGRSALEMTVNPELDQSGMVGAGRIVQDTDGSYHFDNGNNQGALALSNLRSALVDPFSVDPYTFAANPALPSNPASLFAHYGQIVGELGSLKKQDETLMISQKTEQDFITNIRESISGVSLEEELTDLIRFQRAFQASGKMVSSADEMMQIVLQMV